MAADEQLEVLLKLTDELTAPLDKISDRISEFGNELLGLAGTLVSLDAGFKVFDNAADAADKLQDVTRALQTFTGSATAGAQALQFFQQAQDSTRSTALELADAYTRILPLAIRQGWSQAGIEQITVQLDQLAAAAGRAPQELETAFTRLLSTGGGRGAGRNALLQVLGITGQDLSDAGADAGQVLADAIADKLSSLGGTIPDSLKSAWAKAKDDLSTALGTGFSDAFGQGSDGMKALRDMFRDPELLQNIKDIGRLLGQGLMAAIATFNAAVALTRAALQAPTQQGLLNSPIFTLGLSSAGALNPSAALGNPQFSGGLMGTDDLLPFLGNAGLANLDNPQLYGTAGSGAGSGVGGLGGSATQAVTILTQLHDAITQVMTDYKAWVEAGGSDAGFGELQAAHLDKINEEVATLGLQLPIATQNVLDLGGAWTKLPASTDSFANFVKTQGQDVGALIQTPFGIYDPNTGSFTPQSVQAQEKALDQSMAQQSNLADQLAAHQLQVQLDTARQVVKYYNENFRDPFASVLTAAGTGGNVGQALSQALSQGIDRSMKDLVDTLGKLIATPQVTQNADGTFSVGSQVFGSKPEADAAASSQGQAGLTNLTGLAGGALQIAGFAQNLGSATPLQGAISGFSIGSEVTPAINALVGTALSTVAGGLIGAFVGALVTALSEELPTIQTYAIPLVRNGVAGLTEQLGELFSNPTEQQQWLGKIQASFDNFKNGYFDIFLSLPTDLFNKVLPTLQGILGNLTNGQFLGSPTGGGGLGDTSVDGQGNPRMLGTGTPSDPFRLNPAYNPGANGTGSTGLTTGGPGQLTFPTPIDPTTNTYITAQQWQGDIQAWIDQQLPQAIMETFKPAFSQVFDSIGVTVDKFNQIWKTAEGMDPQTALKYLGDYQAALVTFQDLLSKLSTPVGFGNTAGGGLYATTSTTLNQSFVSSLTQGSQDILAAAQGLSLLSGQSQIDQINKVNQLIQARYQTEEQYITQLIGMVQTAKDQLTANILNIQLQGLTPAQQKTILSQHLTGLESSLGSETTAGQLTTDYNSAVSIVQQILGLNPNDPATKQWAIDTLNKLFGTYNTAITAFGNAITSSNQALNQQLQPALALLTTNTNTLGVDMGGASDSVSAMDAAAKSATVTLGQFNDALGAVLATISNGGYTANVRRSRRAA